MRGQWRYSDTKIVEVDFRAPGPDKQPTGGPIKTYDYMPHAGGTLSNGQIFFDMTSAPGEDAIDGIKVDQQGNLYVSGPGGLWVISKEGKHLGTIILPRHPHNFA
ncbi:MAG TPA: SMP-30/gluconolactonase/LRE family protein [Blastocatellia bacterium]|nr:SMP-30/gluconolactonase/LRE family protein [Blastocatellia bacterium]